MKHAVTATIALAMIPLVGCVNLAQRATVACDNDGCGRSDENVEAIAMGARAPGPDLDFLVRAHDTPPARGAHVHLSTSEPITLHEWRSDRWEFACAAPCENPLPVDRTYILLRDGQQVHRPFVLAAPPGSRVVIEIARSTRVEDSQAHEAAAFGAWGTWLVAIFVLAA